MDLIQQKSIVILLFLYLVRHSHARHLHQHLTRINVQSISNTSDIPQSPTLSLSDISQPSNNDQADAPNLGPHPPEPIKLDVKTKKNSIFLKWNMPTTTIPISDYVVRWGLHIPDDYIVVTKSSVRQTQLTDLKPDTDYVISVRARNEAGEGPPKMARVRTSRPDEQEDPSKMKLPSPIGLKAEAISSTSVTLSWSVEPNTYKQSNFLRTVMVRYYINTQTNTSNINYSYKNFTTNDYRVTLDDLKPYTEYGFAVKISLNLAENGRFYKESGWSMDAHARTHEGNPTAPRNLILQNFITDHEPIDPTKLELRWMSPESPNGELRGYQISYSIDGTEGNLLDIPADVNNYIFRDILPEYKYNFKIRARTGKDNFGPFTEVKTYQAPGAATLIPQNAIPHNLIILFVVAILVIIIALSIVVAYLTCRSRKSNKQAAKLATAIQQNQQTQASKTNVIYGTTASVNRMATIGRRRDTRPPDLWINQDQVDAKSTISEKSSEMNLAMVSIKRDSPKFTTQLAGSADIRFQPQNNSIGHYQTSPPQSNYIYYDETDHLGDIQTLNKRHQQRMQLPPPPSQIQSNTNLNQQMPMITSPHQQPPPPPPLNIEQQTQLYNGGNMHNTRSLRINRPLLYDPVAGSFQGDMMNHGTHHSHHPISTLSRRSSTNTMRSFQTYHSQMMPTMPPQAPTPILQNHQAVINQLITTPYPALPLKHVSAVRPQIMSNTQELDLTMEEKSLK